MMNYDTNIRVKELASMLNILQSEINDLKKGSDANDLWDNTDIVQNWKVSKRTLASWRAKGQIDYVQLDGKFWYSKENRDSFIEKYSVRNAS